MRKGRLTVFMGGMFSGKTTELLQKLKRQELADKKIMLFKPQIDTRYSEGKVSSHAGLERDAICVDTQDPLSILEHITSDIDIVGIEEVQFFTPVIVTAVNKLLERGISVIVSGLDLDYRGEFFGSTYVLMGLADFGKKLNAVCKSKGCEEEASRSQRLSDEKSTIVIGEEDKYVARCRDHYELPK